MKEKVKSFFKKMFSSKDSDGNEHRVSKNSKGHTVYVKRNKHGKPVSSKVIK